MDIHVSPCAFMSVDKDRYLYNPDSFFFEGVSSHIEKSLTLFSWTRHLIFAGHMINIYEASSGSFVTSLILWKLRSIRGCHFVRIWFFDIHINLFMLMSLERLWGTFLGDPHWDVHYWFQKIHKFWIHNYTLGILSQSSFQGNQLHIWSNWIHTAYTVWIRLHQ